jgi:glycolate oxidase iron-sulfur subunit
MVEDARAQIEAHVQRGPVARRLHRFIFEQLLPSPRMLSAAGAALYLYEASGLKLLTRGLGMMHLLGHLGAMVELAPSAEPPFFFRQRGRVFPAEGEQRYSVAFVAGCIANVAFARLNEATVRVLQKNGCQVAIPAEQVCCGALHLHSGLRTQAQDLARRNVDAFSSGPFDAIITNAAGCGSTLKEYGELLGTDSARGFSMRVRDVTEFLASIELNTEMGVLNAAVTYQDSCHLAHGQKIRSAPRKLLASIPGLELREMQLSDLCCGSAGIYNVVHTGMAMALLKKKMDNVNATGASMIAASNPGCMLQLRAGVQKFGQGQRVAHVVEILDEAYRAGGSKD